MIQPNALATRRPDAATGGEAEILTGPPSSSGHRAAVEALAFRCDAPVTACLLGHRLRLDGLGPRSAEQRRLGLSSRGDD